MQKTGHLFRMKPVFLTADLLISIQKPYCYGASDDISGKKIQTDN